MNKTKKLIFFIAALPFLSFSFDYSYVLNQENYNYLIREEDNIKLEIIEDQLPEFKVYSYSCSNCNEKPKDYFSKLNRDTILIKNKLAFCFLMSLNIRGCPMGAVNAKRINDTIFIKTNISDHCLMVTDIWLFYYLAFNPINLTTVIKTIKLLGTKKDTIIQMKMPKQ